MNPKINQTVKRGWNLHLIIYSDSERKIKRNTNNTYFTNN